ncbi:hypothetical protein B0F90DRAFT_1668528 [Multifurca ochricompacta]|uniref:Uncharacterized protein n=1 Tax=Multifurca ochricompacta TaxID=376703 RepID=A0AAD4QLU3_9AGAM|nr:hypothetical protein B0F90DRAFT_1668528 [Multifurca ochricompacta]
MNPTRLWGEDKVTALSPRSVIAKLPYGRGNANPKTGNREKANKWASASSPSPFVWRPAVPIGTREVEVEVEGSRPLRGTPKGGSQPPPHPRHFADTQCGRPTGSSLADHTEVPWMSRGRGGGVKSQAQSVKKEIPGAGPIEEGEPSRTGVPLDFSRSL